MNIYYMGESQTDSEFPIVRWNPQVERKVYGWGVTQLPTEEYESKLQGWGEPEVYELQGLMCGLAQLTHRQRPSRQFP